MHCGHYYKNINPNHTTSLKKALIKWQKHGLNAREKTDWDISCKKQIQMFI